MATFMLMLIAVCVSMFFYAWMPSFQMVARVMTIQRSQLSTYYHKSHLLIVNGRRLSRVICRVGVCIGWAILYYFPAKRIVTPITMILPGRRKSTFLIGWVSLFLP